MKSEKLNIFLFLLPGAGFILFFLASAFILTILQSLGFFTLIGGIEIYF